MMPRCPPHACHIVRVSRPIKVTFPPDRRADVGSAATRWRKARADRVYRTAAIWQRSV